MKISRIFKKFSLPWCLSLGIVCIPQLVLGADKPVVAAVNYPLKYFAERIAGDHVDVVFPIPSDIDPAFWVPDPKGILSFQSADLILLNGATYSKWLNKVTLPKRKLVNTSQTFKDGYILAPNIVTHAHGPQGAHAHAGLAFTTWIDFQQAVQHAESILKALVKLRPQHENVFTMNFSGLKQDLLALDERLEDIVVKNRDQPLVASHPVYHYLARRYGLNIHSVHWEPEDVPDDNEWGELNALLENHHARWMVWEGEPNPQSVERLQSMGVGSVVFVPSGNVPAQGDFLSLMDENIKQLTLAFQ